MMTELLLSFERYAAVDAEVRALVCRNAQGLEKIKIILLESINKHADADLVGEIGAARIVLVVGLYVGAQ